jgi:beta-lactam-binding protein with PASTA domain
VSKFLLGALVGIAVAVLVGGAVVHFDDLRIIKNEDTVTVPDLIDENPDTALRQLSDVGLTGRVVSPPAHSLHEVESQVVTDEFPERGSQVPPGSDVTLHAK